jgi:hypothetical protein
MLPETFKFYYIDNEKSTVSVEDDDDYTQFREASKEITTLNIKPIEPKDT